MSGNQHPWQMDDEEYADYVNGLRSAEQRVEAVLRESRYVTTLFPPYSSGAGDLIESLLTDLRREWQQGQGSGEEPEAYDYRYWDDQAGAYRYVTEPETGTEDDEDEENEDEDYTAEVKAQPCEVCGVTPTEGTTESGDRVCGPHGAADQRRGEDIEWDEDAPQQYMLVPVDQEYLEYREAERKHDDTP